ncbi:MAG: hypothetical protein H6703_12550 [Myxococcales bacterium]|nr:hypothetical protein [Myxococcales bacterium]
MAWSTLTRSARSLTWSPSQPAAWAAPFITSATRMLPPRAPRAVASAASSPARAATRSPINQALSPPPIWLSTTPSPASGTPPGWPR